MSTQIAEGPKLSLMTRRPALLIGGAVTMIDAFLLIAPDIGIPIPAPVAKGVALLTTLAGTFGIQSKVRPAKLSIPTPLAALTAPANALTDLVGKVTGVLKR